MNILEIIKEGKSKRLYSTDDPNRAVVFFKDEALAFNGLKKSRIIGKGEVNNSITNYIYTMLENNGIETHYIKQLDARQSLVKRVDMIPFCVKIRNIAAGSLVTRMGWTAGKKLSPPIIEYHLIESVLNNPMINSTHIFEMKLVNEVELNYINETSLKVNNILRDYLKSCSIDLIDFKLEYGRFDGKIVLADEITPDNSRFWDSSTHEPLDMDRFRRSLGDVEESYHEVLKRLMGTDKILTRS